MSEVHEDEWAMSVAEEQAWDDLWETDAARCCSCPSCNFYAPDYEQHKGEPCVLREIILRIVEARTATTPAHSPVRESADVDGGGDRG